MSFKSSVLVCILTEKNKSGQWPSYDIHKASLHLSYYNVKISFVNNMICTVALIILSQYIASSWCSSWCYRKGCGGQLNLRPVCHQLRNVACMKVSLSIAVTWRKSLRPLQNSTRVDLEVKSQFQETPPLFKGVIKLYLKPANTQMLFLVLHKTCRNHNF